MDVKIKKLSMFKNRALVALTTITLLINAIQFTMISKKDSDMRAVEKQLGKNVVAKIIEVKDTKDTTTIINALKNFKTHADIAKINIPAAIEQFKIVEAERIKLSAASDKKDYIPKINALHTFAKASEDALGAMHDDLSKLEDNNIEVPSLREVYQGLFNQFVQQ